MSTRPDTEIELQRACLAIRDRAIRYGRNEMRREIVQALAARDMHGAIDVIHRQYCDDMRTLTVDELEQVRA